MRKNALRSKFAELYEFAAETPKPPLAALRTARGGGIFEENDGGDMLQNSECSEISGVRIPTVSFADSVPPPFGPSGHFPLIGGIGPLCPRGAFVGADAYISPADCTGFSEIFGEFVTSGRADVYR